MDYNLDIVVSENNLSKIGINEIKFFWAVRNIHILPKNLKRKIHLY